MILAALVLALFIVVGTRGSGRWDEAGRWGALALLGQAAALRLIQAGRVIRYEHIALPWEWTGQEYLAGALIVVQAVVVGRALWTQPDRWRPKTRTSPWRLVPVLIVFLLGSSALSPDPTRYGGEILVRSTVQLVALGNAVLIWTSLPSPLTSLQWSGRWPAVAGLLTTLVTALLAVFVYQRHPHVPDEVAYLIQAGYFAAGKVSLVTPPVPSAFNVDLLFYEPTRIYSAFPPGWPAVLAVGVRFGVGWLVNPILAGVNIVLCHRLLAACYDRPTATVGTLMLALSPWHLLLGMSFMSHTLTLTLALGATALVIHAIKATSWISMIGGLLIGAVSLIRPLDGLVLAGTLGLVVISVTGGLWQRITRGAVLAMATAAAGLLVLPYNAALTGRATTFPVMLYFDRYYGPGSNAMGFGPNRGVGWSGIDPLPGHGVADIAINALINLFQVNTELLGWAAGSLAAILALFLWPRRWSGADRAMLLAIVIVIGLHAFYWFSGGPDFGARYWFLLIVPAIALAARGLRALDSATGRPTSSATGGAELAGLALSAIAVITVVPWRAADKYWRFRGMEGGIPELATGQRFGRSLVLIQGRRHPDYHGAAVYNPVDLAGADAPIYAWDRAPEVRAALLAAYPNRPIWIVAGPSLTGSGYRVVAGPLAADAVAALPPPPSFPVPPGPNP